MGATVWLGIVGAVLSAITIFAIYYGPVSALRIQRRLDDDREARNRKMWIFKTLMSNRATRMSPVYVQALNLIDIEFTGENKAEKAVRTAWKNLMDLYTNYKTTPNAGDKAFELNATLLASMGEALGYGFDEVYVKRGAYYPEGLGDVEMEQHTLRKQFLELLDGRGTRKLPVAIFEQRFPDIK